jgi:TonB-linked SusC/RagA family outer membrane protein
MSHNKVLFKRKLFGELHVTKNIKNLHMKKFTKGIVGLLFFLLPLATLAQNKVSGKVTNDKDGSAIVGVTVIVKGKGTATKTDGSGNFEISAETGDVLLFSAVSYAGKSVKVKGNTVNISLKPIETDLEEVVVTAMDRKTTAREVGASVQVVKGNTIAETSRENFLNSLQGRVAGLTVTPTSGVAGASSGIVLRGFNSLSGTNQPLFIVDGIILDNSTLNSNSQGGTGIGLASDGNNRNNDTQNRIADINPNDIESVTVLKGPEATVLYGSQASSGAIVITTKKAKSTGKKILVGYDNNFRFQKITRFIETNNDFGPGTANNIPTALPLLGQFTSFGPAWKPNTASWDNLHSFFQTGFAQTHNLSLEYGNKDFGFRMSGQYFDSKGTVPNNTFKKYNFKISNTTRINKYINITPSVAYTTSDNLRPLKSSASSAGAGGYLVELYEWPTNDYIRYNEDKYGNKNSLFNANRNSDFDNPIWSTKNRRAENKVTRWVSSLGVDINPTKWLAIAGRFGYDTYKDDGYAFIHPQSYQLSLATGGQLDNYYRTYKGYNHTITATAKKKFGNFTTSLMVGTMWQDFQTDQFAIVGFNLIDSIGSSDRNMYKNGNIVSSSSFNPKDSSITAPISRRRLLQNDFGRPNSSVFRELAGFGEVKIGFKNYAFLTYSHRFESASPLPAKNRNFNYPGVSMSLIVSDMIPAIKKGNILNYMKLRGSLANTARLNDPYTNQRNFVNNFSSTVLPLSYTLNFTNANPDLEPERQSTYEVGTELRFLNNLFSIEAAYYNTLCTKQITQGYRASYGTGAVLNTQNAASLRNEGVEITLNLNTVAKKDFTWSTSFNFNTMRSKVLTLPASIGILNDYYNSDTYISNVRGGLIRNQPTGTITGSTYLRNNAGQILISPTTGLPLVNTGTNSLIGERTPDFTLGMNNSIRYKNWSLSFLWDMKIGGDIYNGTDQLLTIIGKSKRTADRATPRIVKGVLNDGLQNSATPTVNTISIIPQYQSAYYSGTNMPDEEFIEKDVNLLRLRDVTLNYRLGAKQLRKLKGIKNVSFFITGNDLVLFSNYTGADPSINANNPGTGGVGGYGMDLGSAPAPLSLSFGLRTNF